MDDMQFKNDIILMAIALLQGVILMTKPATKVIRSNRNHSDLYIALNRLIKPHNMLDNLLSSSRKKQACNSLCDKYGYTENGALTAKGVHLVQTFRPMYKRAFKFRLTGMSVIMAVFGFIISYIILLGPEALETDNLSTKAAKHLNQICVPPATFLALLIGAATGIIYGKYDHAPIYGRKPLMYPIHEYKKQLSQEVKTVQKENTENQGKEIHNG